MNLKKLFSKSLLFLAVTLSVNPAVNFAEELDSDYKNMEQMLSAIRLEKKQVESMVDKLMVSGRINAEEAAKAKRELASMSDNDLEGLKNKAIAQVKEKHLLDH